MGIFGKSDDELEALAEQLKKQRIELDKREREMDVERQAVEHEKELLNIEKTGLLDGKKAFLEQTREEREKIALELAKLETRRIEIVEVEAVAKAGFVEQQRDAFKETIEKRIAQLDAREQEQNEYAGRLAAKSEEIHTAEGELARRELAVTRREQMANAGFAAEVKTMADETTRQLQANQAEAERLRELADSLAIERRSIDAEKSALALREGTVAEAEQKRDAGFLDARAAHNAELRDGRAKAEAELKTLREESLSALDAEIAEMKNRRAREAEQAGRIELERVQTAIAGEREAWEKQYRESRDQITSERSELERRKGALSALQSELEGCKSELEAHERNFERRERRLEEKWQKRNEQIEEEGENLLRERHESMVAAEESAKNEIARLREGLKTQTELVGVFEQLKRQLGDRDPAEVLRDLNGLMEANRNLREELATRPTEEVRERFNEMEMEGRRQSELIVELQKRVEANAADVAEAVNLRRRNGELDAELKSVKQKADLFEGMAGEATAELKRLRAAYERPAEIEDRYKEIRMPLIKADQVTPPAYNEIDELEWLKGIGVACTKYGLTFNLRIMKAFHTALKTAEWSPLTVLAGVSGTGKSELPRLYSHFGGLLFEPLSVQPNWDSQESMLGFFNSIDNKFDAQPVLRFLAQSQEEWKSGSDGSDGYPGLSDAVCLILLDEMNLAHPELYFAEFLSKLELRRGKSRQDVPSLPVKIGAGMPPYQLRLGRNVLWTGTMNQDETTKSLSDKVLDRSIVIHFPRPTVLKRRKKLEALNKKNRGRLLHKRAWQKWLAQDSTLTKEDIGPFKNFVEKVNSFLAVTGRALGHRVWQSIEYYMANYPDVRAARAKDNKEALNKAFHDAFEDQLVQKVMPKLRGIDTRGKSKTDCLDKILVELNVGVGGRPFNLAEDFDLACELGYGQFIWQSANYLNNADAETAVAQTEGNAPEITAENGD